MSFFITGLFLNQLINEALTLIIGVIQLRESVCKLAANDEEFKAINHILILIVFA